MKQNETSHIDVSGGVSDIFRVYSSATDFTQIVEHVGLDVIIRHSDSSSS